MQTGLRGVELLAADLHSSEMGDFAAIDSFAARQFGAFNRAQCHSSGIDNSAIHRRLQARRWIRLDSSVFAVASSPATWERHLMAAVLSRPQALVGGMSAAVLHDFRGIARGKPVIVVPETSNARSAIATVVRHRRFDQLSAARIGGFDVTDVEETVILLGRIFPRWRIESLFDELLIAGRLDLEKVVLILNREAPSRVRGIIEVREILEERKETAPTIEGSYLERLLESILTQAKIGGWTAEFEFSIRGRPSRVDFCFYEQRLIMEADGRNWHMKARDFETDRQRDNELQSRGFRVLRFTHKMLTTDRENCVAELRKALALSPVLA